MHEKHFETPCGTITYWTSWKDAPAPGVATLALLPGLTADHRLFDKQVEHFEGTVNVFTWDAPGHAASRPFALTFALVDKARWLHGILEREGVLGATDTTDTAIGTSTGGAGEDAEACGAAEDTLGAAACESAMDAAGATARLGTGAQGSASAQAACTHVFPSPLILVGQSMGAYVSQAFMQEFPGEAAGFVSIDSGPLQRSYYTGIELWLLKRMEPCYRWYPHKALVRQGAAGCAETAYGRALMEQFIDSYPHNEYAALAGHGYRILAQAVEADLPYKITCPTLLICGENDKAGSTRRYNRTWHERAVLPLEWIPGAGHNSNTDQPALINAAIERFVDQNWNGGRICVPPRPE